MKRAIIPYALFFVVSSIYAYFVSTSNANRFEEGLEWETIPKGSIVELEFRTEEQTVSVRRDEGSRKYWVEVLRQVKSEQDQREEKERFLANETLTGVIDGFSPLRVAKVIGKSSDLKLDEFGLDKSNHVLRVKYGEGKELILKLGKRSFQSTETFVLDEVRGSVVLVDRQFLSPLEKAKARLALLQPYDFKQENVRSVTLKFGDNSREYLLEKKGEAQKWVKKGQSEVVDEAFRNWYEKLLKLRIEGYPNEADLNVIEQGDLKVSVLLDGEKGKLDVLSIYEQKKDGGLVYWLKSESLPVPVSIDTAKISLLLTDLSSL